MSKRILWRKTKPFLKPVLSLRVFLLLFAGWFLSWFVFASYRAWKIQTSDTGFSCNVQFEDLRTHFSYFQLEIKDQHPSEPYFNGAIFLTLGNEGGKTPRTILATFSASRNYGATEYHLPLFYDERTTNLWSGKDVEATITRASGSPRDFPFDSTSFDFDVTFEPATSVSAVFLRNLNPSFYIPCESVQVTRVSEGKYHIFFRFLRNPLVQIAATILLFGGAIFLFAIACYVKRESLPTAIASYFFSLWSIRSILNSEIKTFPTFLDLVILSLCVLLLILVAFRLASDGWPTSQREV